MKSVHPVFYVSQLELALKNLFPSRQQPPHLQWKLMENPSMKFPRFWIPRLIDVMLPHYSTLSNGWAMKALMKKHHGYPPRNFHMHRNLFPTIMQRTRPSLVSRLPKSFMPFYYSFFSFVFISVLLTTILSRFRSLFPYSDIRS